MKFSERKGYKEVSSIIQKDYMTDDLRNALWSVLEVNLWRDDSAFLDNVLRGMDILDFSSIFWMWYLRLPITSRPTNIDGEYDVQGIFEEIQKYYFTCEWYEVYDFLEFLLSFFGDKQELIKRINALLEQDLSAYRFVEGTIIEITNEQEIIEVQHSIDDNDFPPVRNHLQTALILMSDRKKPDYRNSIKESISAVESLVRILTGKPKITLGKALKDPILSEKIHPAILIAFSKLYGYTSDEEGIRHSMLNDSNLSAVDARFFLVSCTAFINFLKSKI